VGFTNVEQYYLKAHTKYSGMKTRETMKEKTCETIKEKTRETVKIRETIQCP